MVALAWVAVVLVLGPSSGRAPAVGVEAVGVQAGPATPEMLPPLVERTAARLDALTVAITGSVEELRASEVVNHRRVEGGVAACMAAAGRRYQQLPFVSFYDGFTDADLGYGTGRATVLDSVTEGGRRLVLNMTATARLARAGVTGAGVRVTPGAPVDVDAFNRCRAPYGHRSYLDIDPPAGAYELSDFSEILRAVSRDRDVSAAWQRYPTCMRDRFGHDVSDRSDFLFRVLLSPQDAPVDGQPPNAAWARGLAELRATFAADVECRFPAYLAAMRVVAAELDAWEHRHRAELDTVRAAWRQRVADAAALPR
jgi:hypothetical protein